MRKTVAPALLALVMSGCSDICQNTFISNADSPTGDLRATVFQRDCGATTDYSTQVSLSKPDEVEPEIGNVFVGEPGRPSAGAVGGPWVELRWLSPRKLLVRYDAKARVFTQEKSVSGVAIIYEKVAR